MIKHNSNKNIKQKQNCIEQQNGQQENDKLEDYNEQIIGKNANKMLIQLKKPFLELVQIDPKHQQVKNQTIYKQLFTRKQYLRFAVFAMMNVEVFKGPTTYIKKRFYKLMADYIVQGNIKLIQTQFSKTQWGVKKIQPYIKSLIKKYQLTSEEIQNQKQRYKQFQSWTNCQKFIQLYDKTSKQLTIQLKQNSNKQICPQIHDKIGQNDEKISYQGNKQIIKLKYPLKLIIKNKNKVINRQNYLLKSRLKFKIQLVKYYSISQSTKQNKIIKNNEFMYMHCYKEPCIPSNKIQQENQSSFPSNQVTKTRKANINLGRIYLWNYEQQLIITTFLIVNAFYFKKNENPLRRKGLFHKLKKYLPQKNTSQMCYNHYRELMHRQNIGCLEDAINRQMKEFKFTVDEINGLIPKLQADIAKNKLLLESLSKKKKLGKIEFFCKTLLTNSVKSQKMNLKSEMKNQVFITEQI